MSHISNQETVHDIDQLQGSDQNKIKDNTLSRIVEKEETFEEELEKNQMKIKNIDISSEDERRIRLLFKKHLTLRDFPDEILELIMMNFILLNVESGKYIFEEKFEGSFCYIIAYGEVEIVSKGKVVKVLKNWDIYNEMSLFCNTDMKHDVSLRCAVKTKIYVLDSERFQTIQGQLVQYKLDEKYHFINNIALFQTLDSISRLLIAESIEKEEIPKNTTIINQGEVSKKVYLIKEGVINCYEGTKEMKRLSNNDFFGIESIISDIPSNLIYIANQKTICYVLSVKSVINALGKNYKDIILFSFFTSFISLNSLFYSIIHEKHLYEFYGLFQLRRYSNEEHLWQSGKDNKKVILIIEGNLIHEYTREYLASRGDIIGDHSLLTNSEIAKKYMAYPHCIVLETSYTAITKFLKCNLEDKTEFKVLKLVNLMKCSSIFYCFSEKTIQGFVKVMSKQKYQQGTQIMTNSDDNTMKGIFILTKGKIKTGFTNNIIQDKEEEAFTFFGQDSLINKPIDAMSLYTVTAIENVSCFFLSKEAYERVIHANESGISEGLKDYVIKEIQQTDKDLHLKDLYYIKTLKKLKHGQLCSVHNNKALYFLRTISRKKADKDPNAKYILSERKISLMINHPFISKTFKTFKSDNYCYILSEYINGKFFDEILLQENRQFKANEVRFYISCLIIIIEYLKQKQIIHRGLTPDNFIIDSHGYLKLINFTQSKIMHDYTSTVIGNPIYTAPEVVTGNGYSFSADYWSIGVLAYNLYYNTNIYQGINYNEPYQIYQSIMNSAIAFPDLPKDSSPGGKYIVDFIGLLLQKNINKRLCSLQSIKGHGLYSSDNYNLESFISFTHDPPIKSHIPPIILTDILNRNMIKYKDYEEGMKLILEGEREKNEISQINTKWSDDF